MACKPGHWCCFCSHSISVDTVAVRAPAHPIAHELLLAFGGPLVARVTNVRFANTVTRWERGTEPDRYALNRMQLVATLLLALEEAFDDPGGAARWLTLDNPSLGFRAPIDALAEGALGDVFAIARAVFPT